MAVDGRIATSRYHGLDFVRALMMSLGVVLHTALVFMPEGWIYMDPDSVAWSPLIVWTIHIFRMSAFFVMAGFFGAMLHARRGTATFLGHRFDRIVVPLVIGWFVLSPLMSWSLSFAWTHQAIDPAEAGGAWAAIALAWERMSLAMNWGDAGPGHLWFLYFLVWYYAAAVLVAPVVVRLGVASRFLHAAIGGICTGRARFTRMPILIGVSFLLMLGMKEPGIDTSLEWAPDWYLLLTYAWPFTVGWLAWHHRGVIDELRRWCWLRLGSAVFLLVLAVGGMLAWHASKPPSAWLFPVVQLLSAAACWTTTLALVGCCERLLRRERPTIRYLVDASYWIYLMHMPLTIAVPALMRSWVAPGLLKMTVSIAITTAILLVTYHVLVRNTIVGVVLSGRRYPAWPFGRAHRPEPAPSE